MIARIEDDKAYSVPTVDNVSITYLQDADCTDDPDNVQVLKLSTQNNGIARFMVLETERWAIDDIESLIEVLQDFKTRAGLHEQSV
jgi:hypothetical protein